MIRLSPARQHMVLRRSELSVWLVFSCIATQHLSDNKCMTNTQGTLKSNTGPAARWSRQVGQNPLMNTPQSHRKMTLCPCRRIIYTHLKKPLLTRICQSVVILYSTELKHLYAPSYCTVTLWLCTVVTNCIFLQILWLWPSLSSEAWGLQSPGPRQRLWQRLFCLQ